MTHDSQYDIRERIAFIAAPAVVPLSVFLFLTRTDLAPNWVEIVAMISAFLAYGGAIALGIPMYRFLRAQMDLHLDCSSRGVCSRRADVAHICCAPAIPS
jgi:hypothetical protein